MKRPNFVIILTDDQGYGDLSCMGSEDIKTPNFDNLAKTGVLFTNWYSNSPVCSPSRASLLTGLYPANAGIRHILGGNRNSPGLMPNLPTIAKALKKIGYKTAMFGKWHLGAAEECRPDKHGFDRWMGFLSGCIDYYSHVYYWCMSRGKNPTHDLWEDGEEIYVNGKYFTEMVTEYSVDYIKKAAEEDEPFFLFISYNAPHYPMHAPEKYLDRYPNLPWDRRIMAAMISAVDDGVGEILDELKRQNIFDNTCIFFQSDNGPSRESRNWMDGREDPYYGGSAGKLKGGKFSLFDGGIRVPAIISWQNKIPAGQIIDEVGVAMDIFPTFLKAAGGDVSEYKLDGLDIMPMLCDKAPSPHKEIYWEMYDQIAIRQGRRKLVLNGQINEGVPSEDKVFLSDIEADMSERSNLKNEYPEIAEELTILAKKWKESIE